VCILHAVPERIVALVGEPGVGLALQGGELRSQVREFAGKVLGGVTVVARSTHTVRISI
jgi:hypothetical protein